jgi:hypothetical protein
MKLGKYKPGEAILRMKQDLDDPNPQMWDLIAYRVLLAPHHRTGNKWKVYPTYDFTHCLVDSFENISYVIKASHRQNGFVSMLGTATHYAPSSSSPLASRMNGFATR